MDKLVTSSVGIDAVLVRGCVDTTVRLVVAGEVDTETPQTIHSINILPPQDVGMYLLQFCLPQHVTELA